MTRGVARPDGGPTTAGDVESVAAMRTEVEALMVQIRAQGPAGDPELLRRARTLQEQVIAAGDPVGQRDLRRLAEVEQLQADAQAHELEERIGGALAAAEQAQAAGAGEEAAAHRREALAWQREINRSAAASARKNFARESRMETTLAEAEAEPLAREVASALAAARLAVERQDWAGALAGYAAAREGQERINAEYPDTRYADRVLPSRIDRELAALDAADVATLVDEREAAGEAALAAEDFEGAAAAFAAARQHQEHVNRAYPASRFQSAARVEALEAKRQTAASLPGWARLRELEQTIARHLARREVVTALALITEAEGRAVAWQAEFPRSERLDGRLRLRLAYLDAQRERLAEVQDAVYARLRPLPGVSELWLLQTEVPQALYQQVMKTNPSRHVGRDLPVDSVSWEEAKQFCERLGWMLGRRVRLPRRDEFWIALGGETGARRAAAAAGPLGGAASRRVAAGEASDGGFFDLLGNLEEWLEVGPGEADGTPAPVIGGSYRDAVARLAAVPQGERPRGARAPFIGFRVVVEMGEEP